MEGELHFETFALGDSFIHRIDPRIRFVCALLLVFTLALIQNFWLAAAGLFLGAILTIMAALPMFKVVGRLAALNGFMLIVWVLLPFSVPGEVLFRLGPFVATWQGFCLTLLITVKSNAIILTSLALVCTMRVITLARVLEALHFPGKICQILFFSLRYFQVIHSEYHRLYDAMTVRAFSPRTNLHTFKTYGYLISMLLVRSLNRGQRVYEAMLCRGYSGHFPALRQFQIKHSDIVVLFFGTALTIAFWALEFYCKGQ